MWRIAASLAHARLALSSSQPLSSAGADLAKARLSSFGSLSSGYFTGLAGLATARTALEQRTVLEHTTQPLAGGSTIGSMVRTRSMVVTASKQEEQQMQEEVTIPGLRTTAWDTQDLRVAYPELEGTVKTDVCVVGGGIYGLSIAYNLLKKGKSVVVLEARCIGCGQTGRTTAHIMPWNDDYYSELESLFGKEKTFLVGDSHRKAIDFIENTVKEENIECKFSIVEGLLFAHNDEQDTMKTLTEEFEASKRAGFEDVTMVNLNGDPSYGGIKQALKFPRAGDFHPLMYIKGLAEAITRMGGKIYEQSAVMSQQGTKASTKGDKGHVEAGAMVLATHSPINHNLLVHARQEPDRSYVLGFKIPKGSVKKCSYWDTDDPYHYIRIDDREDYDVLIVGGADHPVGLSPGDYPDAFGELEKYTRERWTMAGEVLYKWTGMVFEPNDMLHIMGADPANPSKVYIATGDSGEGMTGGTIAGMLISDLIVGNPNPWADLYSPSRIPPPSSQTAQATAGQVVHTVKGYKDLLPGQGTDSTDMEDMAANSGAVINKGLKKLAVYKDSKGKVHSYSAVCPHMKCVVKWNPNDFTFDCPCHGSIFDSYGRVTNGPAKSDLEPAEVHSAL